MFRAQNWYLRNTIGISVKGFSSLDIIITVPGHHNSMTLHQWFLLFKTANGSMQLFTSVDVDPSNVFYFCTHKFNKDEAILWHDKLPTRLWTTFDHDMLCQIREDDDDPSRSYR
eukprot:14109244-Ditylum_brightwellii.AAC.1